MPSCKRFEDISLADTALKEYTPDNQPDKSPFELIIDTDSANAGTIQFEAAAAGSSPAFTNCKAYPGGTKLFISLPRGFNLFAKASAATQKFSITY